VNPVFYYDKCFIFKRHPLPNPPPLEGGKGRGMGTARMVRKEVNHPLNKRPEAGLSEVEF